MKKLFGITIAMMLGLSMIGCEETIEDTKVEEPETKQEQQVEVEVQEKKETEEVKVEEPVEEIIDKFDEEELNYYLTTTLPDEEYDNYFNRIDIKWTKDAQPREIEFDGQILMVTPHEKYNTRCELLLATGDYTDGNFTGPYMKTRDIGYTELDGMTKQGYNVKVKATIEDYDIDNGWLKIDIKEIKAR